VLLQWIEYRNIALRGTFNFEPWLPLKMGDYTIQLVKVEKGVGTIVAERDFSIAPYDGETLAKFTAYLTSAGDPEKYFDTYVVDGATFKGKLDIKIWVQSEKGISVGGTRKFFKTNFDGVVEKTAWDGEYVFKTDPEGDPIAIGGLGGSYAPGIYHNQISIDGNVFADLKIKII
jgi:hypothetical protein